MKRINISENEIVQWMSTGMSRSEAIEEIVFWRNVSKMNKDIGVNNA
jgi:hypothetical protein